MANVFKQFRESKISASLLLEAAAPTVLPPPIMIEENVVKNLSADMAMLVFVVDSSTRRANEKIDTVRSYRLYHHLTFVSFRTCLFNRCSPFYTLQVSMKSHLPDTEVAVISCDLDEEETFPPSRHFATSTKMMTTKRSGKSIFGAGLKLALKLTDDALRNRLAREVVLVVITDGTTQSFVRSPSDSMQGGDSELIDSALSIRQKTEELLSSGFKLKSVIVDTSAGEDSEVAWIEGRMRLAEISGADYYCLPELTEFGLVRYIPFHYHFVIVIL